MPLLVFRKIDIFLAIIGIFKKWGVIFFCNHTLLPHFLLTNNPAQRLSVVGVEKCSSEIFLKIKRFSALFLTLTMAQIIDFQITS
jgi:hypothetical protein